MIAQEAPDPVGMPFSRVRLQLVGEAPERRAAQLVAALKSGSPSVWVMKHATAEGALVLELVPLERAELEVVVAGIRAAMEVIEG